MRDRELGKLVGMTDPDEGEDRTDLYTAVACAVESKIKADAQEDNDIAVRIIRAVIAKPKDRSGFTLGRDLAKKPIMTFGYGVVSYGMCDALMKKLRDDHSEGKIPDEQWEILAESRTFVNKEGEETEGDYLWSICQYLTKLFFDVIKTKISGAANARDWLEKVGKQLAGCGGNGGPSAIQWRSPSKFPVLAVKRKSIPKSIESEMFGKRYIISAYEHTDEVDAGRTASGFPPNMIHSLDAAHLMFTIDRCLSEGMRSFVTTHDCFGCLATDMPRMGQIIRESFVDMYRKLDMTALGGLLSQDNNKDLSTIENPKQTNDLKLDDVLGSEFFFS